MCIILRLERQMGHASDFLRIRRRYAAERIAAHRRFVLHGDVHARCLLVATLAGGIVFFDRPHGGSIQNPQSQIKSGSAKKLITRKGVSQCQQHQRRHIANLSTVESFPVTRTAPLEFRELRMKFSTWPFSMPLLHTGTRTRPS